MIPGLLLTAVVGSVASCMIHRTARVAIYDLASGAVLRGTITVREAPACSVVLEDSLGEKYAGSCRVPADGTLWGAIYFGGAPGVATLRLRPGDQRGDATVADPRGRSLHCEFLTRWGGDAISRRTLTGTGQCRDDASALHLLAFSSSEDPGTIYTRLVRLTPRP